MTTLSMELVREVAKPFYLGMLRDNQVSVRDAVSRGWDFGTFCEQLMENVKEENKKNKGLTSS